MPVENNEINRGKLAQAVVEDADYDAMYEMAVGGCLDLYERDNDKFQEDWESEFGSQQIPESICEDGSIAV
jgi:hypothetical protein